jgi:hypothetical protein
MFKLLKRVANCFSGPSSNVFTLQLQDWAHMAGESVPVKHQDAYRIEAQARTGALDVTVQHGRAEWFGMELVIEINRGVPCVHISNGIGGDHTLHIFATKDGIAVVPDDPHTEMEKQPSSLYYPGSIDRNTLLFHCLNEDAPRYLDGYAEQVWQKVI